MKYLAVILTAATIILGCQLIGSLEIPTLACCLAALSYAILCLAALCALRLGHCPPPPLKSGSGVPPQTVAGASRPVLSHRSLQDLGKSPISAAFRLQHEKTNSIGPIR